MTTTTNDLKACLICSEPTTSRVVGQLGDRTGIMCEDCAYWSDGNVITDLWMDDMRRLSCTKHGHHQLQQAVADNPDRRIHCTSIGRWMKFPVIERRDIAAALGRTVACRAADEGGCS